MDSLASFLDRFRKLKPPEASVKKAVTQALSEVVGVGVAESQIKLVRGAVFVDVDPLVKSEIFLKRTDVLRRIRELLDAPDRNIHDIR